MKQSKGEDKNSKIVEETLYQYPSQNAIKCHAKFKTLARKKHNQMINKIADEKSSLGFLGRALSRWSAVRSFALFILFIFASKPWASLSSWRRKCKRTW